jgi:hypothetical protein
MFPVAGEASMARSIVLALLAVAGSTGPLESCYSVEYRLTLMDDRSGKIEVLISQKLEMDELIAPFPLLDFVDSTHGAAAFTPAKTEVKDGWRLASFTVYFQDINKLVHKDEDKPRTCDQGHSGCLHFNVERAGDGLALTIEDWVFDTAPHRKPKENWEEVRKDSANVVKWTVTLPGEVTKVEGIQKTEGHSAVYERNSQTIVNVEDAVKWPVCARRVVDCGKTKMMNAREAAFRAEMHRAKAAWPKVKSDLEAARGKQVR